MLYVSLKKNLKHFFYKKFKTLSIINIDDTRKIITLYSSMMGRPDLQPQPVKVRTRKTRPERNRKDKII